LDPHLSRYFKYLPAASPPSPERPASCLDTRDRRAAAFPRPRRVLDADPPTCPSSPRNFDSRIPQVFGDSARVRSSADAGFPESPECQTTDLPFLHIPLQLRSRCLLPRAVRIFLPDSRVHTPRVLDLLQGDCLALAFRSRATGRPRLHCALSHPPSRTDRRVRFQGRGWRAKFTSLLVATACPR
jgi:hypothetical protein